jgi:hypothetical protein
MRGTSARLVARYVRKTHDHNILRSNVDAFPEGLQGAGNRFLPGLDNSVVACEIMRLFKCPQQG